MPKFGSGPRTGVVKEARFGHADQAADFIAKQLTVKPDVLLILGSGLGGLADEIKNAVSIYYKDIPYFKESTAPGHAGRLVAGKLAGKNVLAMQGRIHVYEGYSPADSSFPVYAASKLGCKSIIITCACGGVNESYKVGDICTITDHINFTHPGPMLGMDMRDFDARFVDMSKVYDPEYRKIAKKSRR
jgi:purine-nucleoside phosphorylase